MSTTRTVSLVKEAWKLREVRTMDHGWYADLYAWEEHLAPLWWDDASYIRYQCDDGPTGCWRYELNFTPMGEPIRKRWVEYPMDDESWHSQRSASRRERLLWARFATIVEPNPEDAAIVAAAHPIPF